ncbi:MAG: hypothetical protein N3D19_02045, partial [Archaeoglobaceae archaeon]|nr:hypothetical protein [Archaeoglobaceae archaeon]
MRILLGILFLLLFATCSGYELSVEVTMNSSALENAIVSVSNETLNLTKYTTEGLALFELFGGNYTVKATYELCFNESFVELASNMSLTIELRCEVFSITVLNLKRDPIEKALIKVGEIEKLTDKDGKVTINTTELGFRFLVQKDGYLSRNVEVETDSITVILLEDLITFYLGNDENYEILKEIENEIGMIEVFNISQEIDFANKSLIFLANLDESLSKDIVNKTNATIVSYNSTVGYSDENISKYWIYGGKENLLNLVNYLRAKFFELNIAFEAPKIPENRTKILFILDKNLRQVPLIMNASKDLYVEKNLNITILGYSDVLDLKERITALNFSEFNVIFLYMLGYPVQDLLKDHLLPLKNQIKILGMG